MAKKMNQINSFKRLFINILVPFIEIDKKRKESDKCNDLIDIKEIIIF